MTVAGYSVAGTKVADLAIRVLLVGVATLRQQKEQRYPAIPAIGLSASPLLHDSWARLGLRSWLIAELPYKDFLIA